MGGGGGAEGWVERRAGNGDAMNGRWQEQYRLWHRKRGHRDNATDANFLARLVVNASVKRRSLGRVVWQSQLVTQQVCIGFLVPCTFLHLKSGRLSVSELFSLNLGIMAVAGVLLCGASLSSAESPWPILAKSVRQGFLMLAGIYNLSPLYQKLTISISSDTIGASSVLLLAAHLYLHNYQFSKSITETASGAVSLGSAIATSVLLSSRLDSPDQVFSFLSFALALFVLSPFFRKHLSRLSRKAHVIGTLALFGITFRAVGQVSASFAVAFGALIAFTSFVCPWLLVSVEKHKVQISGPWDEAELETPESSAVAVRSPPPH